MKFSFEERVFLEWVKQNQMGYSWRHAPNKVSYRVIGVSSHADPDLEYMYTIVRKMG